ncbi:hypothetical protein J45TS6_20120 [Paenibacillus sp. J45TS6]|uniref:PQQ-binding-like beta-propeller repeat protein n=1 Tax=Paenibacillus sp. J45TS6 TaxID=2807196 RepID=UPI001B1B3C88|nr:PQQ-binding-like beta-propeller repeat protein [Paenibacillus sp. J45TS6]GIP43553.1 hypothetical protein J45TS6_20120 [Paenibacillus sp. J45TS6]
MFTSKDKQVSKRINSLALRRIFISITAGIITVQGAIGVLPSLAVAEPADISIQNWYNSSVISVPELKPTWTAQADSYFDKDVTYSGVRTIAEEGKVFTFAGKKLVAMNAKTGKRIWSYGNHLNPYIVYDNGIIYGLSEDQKPYALNAKTGKLKWKSSTSLFVDTRDYMKALKAEKDTLYAINGSTTFAFDKTTGNLRWKTNEPMAEGSGTDYLEEADGVILRTFYVQGALTSIQLSAFDKKTGKKLWSDFGQGEALQIKDGLVYSVDYYSDLMSDFQSLPERKFIVNAFNLKTGELKGSREYKWKVPGEPPYEYDKKKILLKESKLYIEQADKVAEYNFDTYKADQQPLRTFKRPYGENWELAEILQERLVYKNTTTGEITGVKMTNGQQIGWNGDAPVAQIDVYGNGIYRAQRNGTLLSINLTTTRPVFRVKTGGDLHEATLKTDGMIIIQAEGKLIGVKIPASL